MTFESRFWAKVEKTETCWLWTAYTMPSGYGHFEKQYAHRIAYELLVGPIPAGLELDHVAERGCTNRNCVNPEHLEPVTHAENIRRSIDNITAARRKRMKDHCKHGHPFDAENTYVASNGRQCRTCNRTRAAS